MIMFNSYGDEEVYFHDREKKMAELEDWYSVLLYEMTDEQLAQEYADRIGDEIRYG